MRIIRSIAAIAAGFGFMASTVRVGTIVATALFIPGGPGGLTPAASRVVLAPLPIGYLAANLIVGMLGAVLGGWLAARIAAHAPFAHAVALAAIVASLSVATAVNTPAGLGPQPDWYVLVLGVIGVTGVLLGGWLRASAAATPPAAGV